MPNLVKAVSGIITDFADAAPPANADEFRQYMHTLHNQVIGEMHKWYIGGIDLDGQVQVEAVVGQTVSSKKEDLQFVVDHVDSSAVYSGEFSIAHGDYLIQSTILETANKNG